MMIPLPTGWVDTRVRELAWPLGLSEKLCATNLSNHAGWMESMWHEFVLGFYPIQEKPGWIRNSWKVGSQEEWCGRVIY